MERAEGRVKNIVERGEEVGEMQQRIADSFLISDYYFHG